MTPPTKSKPVFDGAKLSPKLKPKADESRVEIPLPIGKASGAGGVGVARAYKHAAGKSDTYAVEVVDMIYHMAREGPFSEPYVGEFVAAKLSAEQDASHLPMEATWDHLVFLSANLTRLVIDPYRERCNSLVEIGPNRARPLTLKWPIVFSGVDFGRLSKPLMEYVDAASVQAGLATTVGSDGPSLHGAKIIAVDVSDPQLDGLVNAEAIELTASHVSQLNRSVIGPVLASVRNSTHAKIPIGVVAPAIGAESVVDETVDLDIDFFVADGQWTDERCPTEIFPELSGAPAIHVLADTVERLRHHCREHVIQVIYRGGIRSGADAGKALCLGATAVSLGLSAVVGMGFKITKIEGPAELIKQLSAPIEAEDATRQVYNFAKSVNMEVTMLARACGKSSVTNMEPEDLRALNPAVSAATGVPVAGKDFNFRHVTH